MSVLTIVARIEAHPDRVELVKSELLKLIEPTRKERGCLKYDLHQDNERPELFVFYEGWESNTNQYKKVIYSACFLTTNSRRMDDGMVVPL